MRYAFGLEPALLADARRLARLLADGGVPVLRVSVRRIGCAGDFQRTILTAELAEPLPPQEGGP